MLYEVVDGKVVEKEMGASEVEIAGIFWAIPRVFRRGRSDSVALSSNVSSASIKPRIYSEGRTLPLFRMQVGPFAVACPMSQSGTWCPTWQSRSLARTNTADHVQEKIHDYFAAGVRRVWVVYPRQQEVYVYASPTEIQVLQLRTRISTAAI